MTNAIAERANTAKLRFYVFQTISVREKFRYLVCDGQAPTGSKTLAKFREERQAEMFVRLIRAQYVSNKFMMTIVEEGGQ
jgi:hypothetical protein